MEVLDYDYMNSVISAILQNYRNMKLCFRSPVDLLMSVYKSPIRSIINPINNTLQTITIGDEMYSWVVIDFLNELLVQNSNDIRSLLVNGNQDWLILPCDYDRNMFENDYEEDDIDDKDCIHDDNYKCDNYVYDSINNNIKHTFAIINEYSESENGCVNDTENGNITNITNETLTNEIALA